MRFLIFDFTSRLPTVIIARISPYSLLSMRRYTPLVLLAVIPLILSSCWKKDEVSQIQNTETKTEVAPYTTAQYEAMFATKEKE